MVAKNIFYKPDGSGRDTYIETTSGGSFNTLQSTFDYRIKFMNSLRTYEKSRRETPLQFCQSPVRQSLNHDQPIQNKQFYFDLRTAAKKIRKQSMRQSMQNQELPNMIET